MSDQFLFGFGISLPSGPGTCLATASNNCGKRQLDRRTLLRLSEGQAIVADR